MKKPDFDELIKIVAGLIAENLSTLLFKEKSKLEWEVHSNECCKVSSKEYSLLVNLPVNLPRESYEIQLIDDEKSRIGICTCIIPYYLRKSIIHSAKADFKQIKDTEELNNLYTKFKQVLDMYEDEKQKTLIEIDGGKSTKINCHK